MTTQREVREQPGDLYAGLEPRDCGEHRTVGERARCFDCSTWCYPDAPCPGCEVVGLR